MASSSRSASSPAHTAPAGPGGIPAAVYWLALGAFAIGTEGFMISPLLPGMAADLRVSMETAGQLVTAFTLAYALSSPVLTALTGGVSRRRLLLLSMAAFALANLLAWRSPGYWTLMGARVLLAFAAGLYVPGANALASAIVPAERRGRALAVVNGGITMAIALGVPLGAWIGHSLGWRTTFAGVALLSVLAAAALVGGLPKGIGAGVPVASLRERVAVLRHPVVVMTLLVTTLWATGAYVVYTYLALFLAQATGYEAGQVSAVLFLWGVAAAVGLSIGGHRNDRHGPGAVIVPAILSSTAAFVTLSLSATWLAPVSARLPVVLAIAVWGAAHWGFFPAQQSRLIQIAGVKVAAIVLSLNASFMYIGFSIGAALGGWTIAHHAVADLGWVAASCEIAAVLLTLALQRHLALAKPRAGLCPAAG